MRPLRPIVYARLTAMLVLGAGFAFAGASAQEPAARRQATFDMNADQNNLSTSVRLPRPTSSAIAAVNPQVTLGGSNELVGPINPLWASPLASFPATRDRPIFSP